MPDELELRLADGRLLAGSAWGPVDGKPVLWFHGMPGCRSEPALFCEPAVSKLGIRLIAFERPGYGKSDPKPGRQIIDWADDVAEAATLLKLEKFAIIGFSGGAAFAAACVAKLPARLSRAVIISGLGPLDGPGSGLDALSRFHPQRLMLGLGARMDLVLRFFAWLIAMWGRRFPRSLLRRMGAPDQRVGKRFDLETWFRTGLFGLPFVQGSAAVVTELRLSMKPWGLVFGAERVPVTVFQGEFDLNCPPKMGRSIADRIPGAEFVLVPDAGHLMPFDHADRLFAAAIA